MKIALNEIGSDRRHFSVGATENWRKIFAERHGINDITFIRQPKAEVDIYRSAEEIFITGRVDAAIRSACVSCLCEIDQELDFEFNYNLMPAKIERQLPGELELDDQDIEVSYYSGEKIDLAPLISEQILLEAPINPKCKSDCAGLCHKCGADLNKGECGCDRTARISPFAGLEKFKK